MLGLALAVSSCTSQPPERGVAEQIQTVDSRAILLDPTHPAWSEPAPDTFRADFETTRGTFVVEVVRAWAPIGADRFYNLIRHGYYDDVRFHRTVPGFITQWGVSGDPEVSAVWYGRGMAENAASVTRVITYNYLAGAANVECPTGVNTGSSAGPIECPVLGVEQT